MRKPTSILALVLGILFLLPGALTTRAEVAAEVDWRGNYVRTIVYAHVTVSDVKIWTAVLAAPGYIPLNKLGDLNGDLWPVIVEDPDQGNRPWVLWSRFNGSDYDLAWSRWGDGDWQDVRWLESTPRQGDDLDPDMTLGSNGRPHVTWWTYEGGTGQVYFSMYLNSRWMSGYLVSDVLVDSRDPSITFNDDGTITIEYMTPSGPESRTIVIANNGNGINDDFDPFSGVTAHSMSN